MHVKPSIGMLTTAALLIGSLLLPGRAAAHDHHHGGHGGHSYQRDHGRYHQGKQRRKHGHRVVHEYHYAPAYLPTQLVYPAHHTSRVRGGRNRITITYNGDLLW